MKALKVWTAIVFILGIGCYLWGILSGEFNRFNGFLFYGKSNLSAALLLFCACCLVLTISLIFVIIAFESEHQRQNHD